MRTTIIFSAIMSILLCSGFAMALGDITIESYTDYQGTGQYYVATSIMAETGTLFTDTASMDADSYSGSQYVTDIYECAVGIDEVEIENGELKLNQHVIDRYDNETTHTDYNTGLNGTGSANSFVFADAKTGWSQQYAESDDYAYTSFGQTNHVGDDFDYGIESGTASIGEGSVYMENFYAPINSTDAWSFSGMNTSYGMIWFYVNATKSLNITADYWADSVTWAADMKSMGSSLFDVVVESDEDMNFNADAYVNDKMHYNTTIENRR